MSTPTLEQHANGVWYIHWTDGRRSKRVSTRQTDLAKAKTFLGQWLLMGPADTSVAGNVTISELWDVYHKGHVAKNVASKDTVDFTWVNLKQHFGGLTTTKISQAEIDSYEGKRSGGVIGHPSRPSTIRRELSQLLACLNWCAAPERKIIAKADVPIFKLPVEGEARDRWLSQDEIQLLLAKAEARRRGKRLSRGERFLWLALSTGARSGAILDLTWDRVDFQTGMIHYNVPGRKKTKKRRASVPIAESLRPVLLKAWGERDKKDGGKVVGAGTMKRYVYLLAAAAGVPGVSPHVLRHTAATHMARNGIPLKHIADVLGDTVATVEKHYAHHCPGAGLKAVNTIPAGLVKEAAE
jgi:integrase